MTTTHTSGAADLPEALRSIQRFEVVDCIDDKHVPAVIPNPHGQWVRYEDHIAALAAGQATAVQQGAAYAALPDPIEIDWPELHSHALGCGVEDRGLHNRYECAEYGWQDGVDKCADRVPEQIFDADQMRAFADATCALRTEQPAPSGATEEVENLRKALVYAAFALHGTPQYMLAQGMTLIDGDTVRVSRDGWTVEASVNPHRQPAPATQQAGEAWQARASHGQAPAEVSPTAGMNIPQRILHVGGRNNDAGYAEFGSIQAVEALVRQVLRDLPALALADSKPAPVHELDDDACRCEPSDYVRPADYDGDGSVAAMARRAARATADSDLITIRKPTTSAELLWLLKLVHLVISDAIAGFQEPQLKETT